MTAIDDLTTYVTAARTAIDSGDFQTAARKLALAKATFALLPDTDGDGVGVKWGTAIKALDEALTLAQRSRGGGVHMQRVEFG